MDDRVKLYTLSTNQNKDFRKLFWSKMQNDLGKLSELLSSARQHAIDGDYYSAQTEYEEFKSQIEKRGSHLRVPSIKRV